MKKTTFNIIDAIVLLLPKLTKPRLMEIMLLCNAWSNGIPLANIKRVPTGTQELGEEIESLQLLNRDLEQKNYILAEEYKEQCERIRDKDETIKKVIAENRALKNRVFMSTGVKT